MIGQLADAVEVGIEPEAQGSKDQDLPLRHTGAVGQRADRPFVMRTLRQHFGENLKDPVTHVGHGVDILQTAQQSRDIVTRRGVDFNISDVLFAELQLQVNNLTHE